MIGLLNANTRCLPLRPSAAFHFNLSLSEPVPGAQSFIPLFMYSTCFIILQYGPRTVAGYVLRECTVLWERQPRKQQLTFSVIGWAFACLFAEKAQLCERGTEGVLGKEKHPQGGAGRLVGILGVGIQRHGGRWLGISADEGSEPRCSEKTHFRSWGRQRRGKCLISAGRRGREIARISGGRAGPPLPSQTPRTCPIP